jgi:hypothetical protein
MSGIRLSDNPQYDLYGSCGNFGPGPPCRYTAKLDRAALLERFGDMELGDFRRRMRCPKCGHRGGEVTFVSRLTEWLPFSGV